jgi:hypothetical protein
MRSKSAKEFRSAKLLKPHNASHQSYVGHSAPASALPNTYFCRTWDDSRMREDYLDQGIAGSLTMIFLTLASIILFRSFYKRYKRMEQRRIEDEQK